MIPPHKKTLKSAKVFILILSNLLNGIPKFDAYIGNTCIKKAEFTG